MTPTSRSSRARVKASDYPAFRSWLVKLDQAFSRKVTVSFPEQRPKVGNPRVTKYGREMGARVLPIYGGQPIVRQLRALKQGVLNVDTSRMF